MGVFGNLLGGAIADCLAKRLGYHGRPLSATGAELSAGVLVRTRTGCFVNGLPDVCRHGVSHETF